LKTYLKDVSYGIMADGTWSHKMGNGSASTGVIDPVQNARNLGYTTIVGYYYITEVCDEN
jgi:hypothetical protein